MVKNQKGGNKSKKFGRKFMTQPLNRPLRLIEDEDERFAVVTKLLGQGMMYVDVDDKSTTSEMICIIRKKFKGRSKRDNTVKVGSLVLIGLRSWELLKEGSKPKCDLLEVYNDSDVNKLKKGGYITKLVSKIKEDNDDDGIVFEDEQTSNYKTLIEENSDNDNFIGATQNSDSDEEIDIDDI